MTHNTRVTHHLLTHPITHPTTTPFLLQHYTDICMENLSTLNNFFDGRDESWFYLITVEVEARGAASIVPIMLSIDAIQRYNEEQEHRRHRRKSRAGSNLSTASEDEYHQRDVSNGTGTGSSSNRVGLSNRSLDYDVDESNPYDRRLMSNDVEEMDANAFMHLDAENGFPYDEEALIGELSPVRVAAYVTVQLKKVALGIKGMCDSLSAMREGCHPFIFYHRVRPFLSAWKHNPTLPKGVIYEGVSNERQQYYGGSAAQSSLLPFLDIALGVSHQSIKSQDFLRSMREYMPKAHREFLGYLEQVACVREFVVESLKNHGITPETRSDDAPAALTNASHSPVTTSVSFSPERTTISSNTFSSPDLIGTSQSPAAIYWAAQQQQQQQKEAAQQQVQQQQDQQAAAAAAAAKAALAATIPTSSTLSAEAIEKRRKEKKIWINLRDAYDECIEHLQNFRTGHIGLVADYILAQQTKGKDGKPISRNVSKDNLESSAGGKGTGGTDLMKFLKPIRDNCAQSLLTAPVLRPGDNEESSGGKEEETPDEHPYIKDNGGSEDIDLYRGAAYPTGRMLYTIPVDHGWNVVTNPVGGSFNYQYQ